MPLFGDRNEAQEMGKQMQSLSEQIGALGRQVADKNAEIERLSEELAQAKAQGQSAQAAQATAQNYQQQVQQFQQQLSTLQAQTQAGAQSAATHESDLHQQVQQLQQQLADMQSRMQSATNDAPPAADAAHGGGLQVGGQAWVTRVGGLPLRLRSRPGLAPDTVLHRLPPGTQMTLLDGPQDADGYIWWHIRTSDGREGWVAGNDLRPQPD